ncbi:MAG: hypothetical protein INH34_05525 [Phycisphaerales bacterium]|jgi:hypothetical protein|nr:hypothetical protein [Phycisphaerales bacterium]
MLPLRAVALAGLFLFASCGQCLWIERRPANVQVLGGRTVDLEAMERQFGALEGDDDTPLVPALFSGLLLDWVDTVWAPVQGVRAMLSEDYAIDGGFGGWLLAFATPFASLSPGAMGPNPQTNGVDPQQIERLRTATGAERAAIVRALFANDRVVDVIVR